MDSLSRRAWLRLPASRRDTAFIAVTAAMFAAYTIHNAFPSLQDWHRHLFADWLYDGLLAAAAIAITARAVRRPENRRAWIAIAAGVTIWTVGDVDYTLHVPNVSTPSWADAGYLLFYPFVYVGLTRLVLGLSTEVERAVWIDGGIAALATAAVGATFVFEPVMQATDGNVATVVTNLAYPIGDIVLLSGVVGAFAVAGWRPGRMWFLTGAGLALTAIADAIYLVQGAAQTYVDGTLLDVLWPLSMLLLAVAAWQPEPIVRRSYIGDWQMVIGPAACGALALLVVIRDSNHGGMSPGEILAIATLALVLVRTCLAIVDNRRLLRRSRVDAVVDALTGLGNRRLLLSDLEAAFVAGEPKLFAIFDLDGFKIYNDSFGHPTGDALLAQLGSRLADTVGREGSYRLGGDEFCVLVPAPADPLELLRRCAGALSQSGEGFHVEPSYGAVELPAEVADPAETLRLADTRLFERKFNRQSQRGRPHELLLGALAETKPELHGNARAVAALAAQIGSVVRLDPQQQQRLEQAALLHDIGKIAIPDDVLHKTGALSTDEEQLLASHPLSGQRILSSSPALRPVGVIVRATLEHWDGSGHPDGLAGEAIPLEARIIAVCDAFDSLVAGGPGPKGWSTGTAYAEISLGTGKRYDPQIVGALGAVLGLGRPATEAVRRPRFGEAGPRQAGLAT